MLQRRKNRMQRDLRLHKNNQGVTLVEVIAVVAVLSVVLAAVVGFMLTGTRMSAQVTGEAGVSIREQTAVEFINKTLYKATISDGSYREILEGENDPTPDNDRACYATLILGADPNDETAPRFYAKDGKVYYKASKQASETELCSGTIYFIQDPTTNTVTYVLNDTTHIVHMRVGS